MDWLEAIPALARVALVLALVLALLRFKLHLGLALLAGSVALALLFRVAPINYGRAVWRGLFDPHTIYVVVFIVGIILLTSAMSVRGQMDRLVERFRAMVGESRIMLWALPAAIGLLPMPGGAVFSAPLVDAATQRADLSAARKTVVNYWFRHVWEFWYPLYPGVILAVFLSGAHSGGRIQMADFVLLGMPMSLVALAAGYVVLLRTVRLPGERRIRITRANLGGFIKELAPILIMIAALLLLGPLARFAAARLPGERPLLSVLVEQAPALLGLAASLGWVVRVNRMPAGDFVKLLGNRNVWSMALLVVGIMIFRQVLKDGDMALTLKDELLGYRIPLLLVVMLLPFIAGLISGIAVGYVGVSFPVVLPLLEGAGVSGGELLPYVFLAFGWGFAGMMLSPVHACLLLTGEYFKPSLAGVYRQLLPLCAAGGAAATGLFFLYR